MVSLVITDEAGKQVQATGAVDNRDYRTLQGHAGWDLRPMELVTFSWEGDEWINLSEWGYSLLRPGTYTIEAIPMLGGNYPVRQIDSTVPEHRTNFKSDGKTIQSNKIEIRIVN